LAFAAMLGWLDDMPEAAQTSRRGSHPSAALCKSEERFSRRSILLTAQQQMGLVFEKLSRLLIHGHEIGANLGEWSFNRQQRDAYKRYVKV
jgi:hypothetical protein